MYHCIKHSYTSVSSDVDKVRVSHCGLCLGVLQGNMNTVKFGPHGIWTPPVCTCQPMECSETGHNSVRSEPTGVASVLAMCCGKVRLNQLQQW